MRQKQLSSTSKQMYILLRNSKSRKINIPEYKNVTNAQEVLVVGAGPAGLFAALY
jgi:heterodisulfide reductase subunit A-like polyferredoxin